MMEQNTIEFSSNAEEYVFTSAELALLLAATGSVRSVGFALPEAEDMEQAAIIQTIHGLLNKGMIEYTEDGGTFRIVDTLADMFQVCGNAKNVFRFVEIADEQIPRMICYKYRDRCMTIAPCDTLSHGWVIRSTTISGIISELQNDGLLPREDSLELIDKGNEETAAQRECLLEIQCVDCASEIIVGKVKFMRSPMEDLLVFSGENDLENQVYAYEQKLITDWMENDSAAKEKL